ncbi:hypothetical protein [Promicromonospora sp. NPDC023987]|uniref:hypothetical protein n=1 Tax=Promicromonospora sp. NPDC023987 TaxID=3155360 RepID=UPI0033ED3ED7
MIDLFAVGARAEITDVQSSLVVSTGQSIRMYPRLPGKIKAQAAGEPNLLGRNHAEAKLLQESVMLGVEPKAIIASKDFCEGYCAPLIERFGGRLVTSKIAIFGS